MYSMCWYSLTVPKHFCRIWQEIPSHLGFDCCSLLSWFLENVLKKLSLCQVLIVMIVWYITHFWPFCSRDRWWFIYSWEVHPRWQPPFITSCRLVVVVVVIVVVMFIWFITLRALVWVLRVLACDSTHLSFLCVCLWFPQSPTGIVSGPLVSQQQIPVYTRPLSAVQQSRVKPTICITVRFNPWGWNNIALFQTN